MPLSAGDAKGWMNRGGLLPFLLGMVLCQIVFQLVLGVPLALVVGLAIGLKLSDTTVLIAYAAVPAIGATLSAAIGSALGKRRDVPGAFVAGATVVPVLALLQGVVGWLRTGPIGLAPAALYAIAAAGLVLGFRHGRKERDAAPAPVRESAV